MPRKLCVPRSTSTASPGFGFLIKHTLCIHPKSNSSHFESRLSSASGDFFPREEESSQLILAIKAHSFGSPRSSHQDNVEERRKSVLMSVDRSILGSRDAIVTACTNCVAEEQRAARGTRSGPVEERTRPDPRPDVRTLFSR